MYFYSVIVPVYNRPNEVDELLESLTKQTYKNFEVIIVEDGSSILCKDIVDNYAKELDIKYFFKENTGPGFTRNYGAEQASGEYLIMFDSDCIIPEKYIEIIEKELAKTNVDAFGGPDKALDTFTPIQKAINYSMTSFFTTGGIRGGKKKIDRYYPRGFNFGIRRSIFDILNGFSKMRFGEDIDFSIRIYQNGYYVKFIPNGYVYHKRRTDFKKFFKQIYNSGIARINLYKKYPNSLKIVHLLPSIFTIYTVLSIILLFIYPFVIVPIVLFSMIILIDASVKNNNLIIGCLSIIASFIQLFAYGTGFIIAFCNRIILKRENFSAFEQNFYK